MKAYVNKTTGHVYELNMPHNTVVDNERNRIGVAQYPDGIPEGELVDYSQGDVYANAGALPEYDDTYQMINEAWSWDTENDEMKITYEVEEWRTQEEAEAEAAAAAVDVTPDSPDSA